jgi:hypothetical protein
LRSRAICATLWPRWQTSAVPYLSGERRWVKVKNRDHWCYEDPPTAHDVGTGGGLSPRLELEGHELRMAFLVQVATLENAEERARLVIGALAVSDRAPANTLVRSSGPGGTWTSRGVVDAGSPKANAAALRLTRAPIRRRQHGSHRASPGGRPGSLGVVYAVDATSA